MPVYEYECAKCGTSEDAINSVDDRHSGAPSCFECERKMKLIISACMGIVDFPAAGGREYVSTTTGRAITSKRQRIDDLKRSGCRPYEGLDQEMKEAKKNQARAEKKRDAKLHDAVASAYHQLSPKKRRLLDNPPAA
jgi:putative FmdB family regulatory protein